MIFKRSKVFLLVSFIALTSCGVSLDPITDEQHYERALTDYSTIYESIAPLEEALTLEEAVSRGLKYNLDYRVTLMERTLQRQQLTVANFAMLPEVAASVGYDMRDKERASRSISLLSRNESLEPSFSEEKEHLTADLTFSWNLLDFGLSYFQAKQQADRVLVAVERRRQVMNKMTKEIIHTYWRAAKAQNLLPKVTELLARVDNAIQRSERIEDRKLRNPTATLEYRKNLLQISMQLKNLRTDLLMSKSQLASLISIPQNQNYTLEPPVESYEDINQISVSLQDLQDYGLTFRPELREEGYQERIDEENVKKEILRLFPGLSLVASTNYDSNDLLYYNDWNQLGVRATWNLVSLIQGKSALDAANTQVEMAKVRRLAQSAAILAQIGISYNQYDQALEEFDTADKLSMIEMRMFEQARKERSTNNSSLLDEVLRETEAINARLERDNKFIETQSAYHNLLTSIGLDVMPGEVDVDDIDKFEETIANALKEKRLVIIGETLRKISQQKKLSDEENGNTEANESNRDKSVESDSQVESTASEGFNEQVIFRPRVQGSVR